MFVHQANKIHRFGRCFWCSLCKRPSHVPGSLSRISALPLPVKRKQPCARRTKPSAEPQTRKWQPRSQGWTIKCHQEQFASEMGLSESKQRVSHLTRTAPPRISVAGACLALEHSFQWEETKEHSGDKNDSKCHCSNSPQQGERNCFHSACQVQVVEKQGWKGKVKVI